MWKHAGRGRRWESCLDTHMVGRAGVEALSGQTTRAGGAARDGVMAEGGEMSLRRTRHIDPPGTSTDSAREEAASWTEPLSQRGAAGAVVSQGLHSRSLAGSVCLGSGPVVSVERVARQKMSGPKVASSEELARTSRPVSQPRTTKKSLSGRVLDPAVRCTRRAVRIPIHSTRSAWPAVTYSSRAQHMVQTRGRVSRERAVTRYGNSGRGTQVFQHLESGCTEHAPLGGSPS